MRGCDSHMRPSSRFAVESAEVRAYVKTARAATPSQRGELHRTPCQSQAVTHWAAGSRGPVEMAGQSESSIIVTAVRPFIANGDPVTSRPTLLTSVNNFSKSLTPVSSEI